MSRSGNFRVDVYDPKRHKIDDSWVVTMKIDGVRVVYRDGVPTSRTGKPLYNLPPMPDGTYECFVGDWNTTVSRVRTENGEPIPRGCLYRIDPGHVDHRLLLRRPASPSGFVIDVAQEFASAKLGGYEGIVLHGPNGEMLKVKDKQTYDVPVTGHQWGRGKHKGRMGALLTPMGKVGTGFSDAERVEFFDWWVEGGGAAGLTTRIIEVECMELTLDGKFRHPRYVRLREDKMGPSCGPV